MQDLSLHDAIFSTRAMRHLKSDPVPREDLEYLVEAATMAPSAGNLQMWKFIVVTSPEQRQKLASLHQEIGYQYIHEEILADPNTEADRRRVYTKAMHNVEHLDEAPAIIIICLTMPCPDDAGVASGMFGSVYPAAQNLLLAARSRGLGGVIITLGTDYAPILPVENPPIGEILNIPDHIKTVAMIPIGYPKGNWGQPWRRPWQECIHWERHSG
ncbi:MAG: hypothetical protein CL726_11620 [Chloroflexi bacterium]|nr:hypothetical protein [Chloroflexota bacterium]